MHTMGVQMSLLSLALSLGITLIEAQFARTAPVLGRASLWVLPLAVLADAASDLVRASRDDGAVVVRIRVGGAGDRREERIGRVAVPAGVVLHGVEVRAERADGADAGVAVLVLARGILDLPEIGVVARERALHRVLADDGVGVADDVADVVAGPGAEGVGFDDGAAVFDGVGVVADADLADVLADFHAAFGGAVAAGQHVAVAVGFVEDDFVTGPEDDSVVQGSFGHAVGLVVGEQGGCSR